MVPRLTSASVGVWLMVVLLLSWAPPWSAVPLTSLKSPSTWSDCGGTPLLRSAFALCGAKPRCCLASSPCVCDAAGQGATTLTVTNVVVTPDPVRITPQVACFARFGVVFQLKCDQSATTVGSRSRQGRTLLSLSSAAAVSASSLLASLRKRDADC